MNEPRYPLLYQVNTRVWLTELSQHLGRPATLDDVTLDDIPDAELDRLAELGIDWIWFLSVWQTGPGAQQVPHSNAEWRHVFHAGLGGLGASHQTGWTGVIARAMHLFATTSAENLLESGRVVASDTRPKPEIPAAVGHGLR